MSRRTLARLAALAVLAATIPGRAGLAQEPDAAAGSAAGEQAVVDSSAAASVLTDPREAELDAMAAEVASGLRCPVCRNQSVVESNAELSREMHRLVRERLAAGETPDEVRAYFVSRYGEWILLQPQARGINLLVYALPLLVLILGFFLARNRLRKWAASGESRSGATSDTELKAEDEEWLREALRES